MKKFSNITNQKISEEPKVEVKLNEEELFKSKVINLMDQLLSVRTYGPVDRYLRAGLIKIAGKEMFAEALIDLMTDKSLKEQTKLLENLKTSINDWNLLDTKIDEMNIIINECETKKKLSPYKNKLKSLFESYKDDEEMMIKMIEKTCNKLKNPETTYLRFLAANQMSNDNKYPKELFNKISEKFKERSKELGHS